MATDKTIQEISQLLNEFIKIIKVVAVYPDDNPLPQKLKESFSDRFADMIRELDKLTFVIKQDEIFFEKEPVFNDRKTEDKLAGLFFKAGINELAFTRDFDFNECNKLFKVMKAHLNREAGASDLVALLWEADIPGFGYTTLEDVMLYQYDDMLVKSIQDKGEDYARHPESEDSTGGEFSFEDIFNENAIDLEDTGEVILGKPEKLAEDKMGLAPTPPKQKDIPQIDTAKIVREAFHLDKKDMNRIEEILEEDSHFDPYENAAYLMSEIIWQQREYADFDETMIIMEKVQTEFTRDGRLREAADLLINLKDLQIALKESRPKWVERIAEAIAVAGGRERLSRLAETLNNNLVIAPTELGRYLSVFGWESLLVVTDLLGELEHQHHRESVCDFLTIHGKDHVDFIGKAIYDKKWYVVRNAASVLARIGGRRAFAFLEKAVKHEEPRVRQEIVKKLAPKTDPESLRFLAEMVWDENDPVRREAIEAILAYDSTERYSAITGIIDDDRFAAMKESYQEAFIVAFSRLGGKAAVDYLVKLTSGWGLFRTQAQEFYERIAFEALGNNSSEEARQALEKLAKSWKKKVKVLAEEALTQWYANHRSKL